jgi:hypothetical protein
MIVTRRFRSDLALEQENKFFLRDLEKELLSNGILQDLILEYEYGKGKLQHIHIIPGTLTFQNKDNGQLSAGYELNEYSLCAAIDYTASHQMWIKVAIENQNEFVLTGEMRYERSDEL